MLLSKAHLSNLSRHARLGNHQARLSGSVSSRLVIWATDSEYVVAVDLAPGGAVVRTAKLLQATVSFIGLPKSCGK